MKCRICGDKRLSVKYKIGKYMLLECLNCNIVYVHPQEMKEKTPVTKFSFVSYFFYLWSFRFFKKYFELIMENAINKKSLLDLGCGHGVLLKIAKKEKISVRGVEQCPTLFLKGVPYIKSRIEDYHNGKYDIIVMKDVLEHLEDPVSVLKKAYKWLNDNGTLVISVPDINSNQSYIYDKDWKRIAPREHLFYFCEESLDYICERIGLIKGEVFKLLSGSITCIYYKLK